MDPSAAGIYERIGNHIKGARSALERLEGGRDILHSPNFERISLETKPPGRRLNLAHLQHGEGITDIADGRQPAETRNSLAQKFELLASKIRRQG